MKAEWRFASAMFGGQCVMTPGEALMLLWCADSWDTPLKVRYISKSAYRYYYQ